MIRFRAYFCLCLGLVAQLPVALADTAAADPNATDRNATGPLQEVLVTASLLDETDRSIPASVTVLPASELEHAGVQHLEDVLGLVPNLNWSSGSSRPRYFQLRGVGEREQFQGAPNASVGFLIDDIDFSGVGMPATLYDVGQIEVLRGPQGTSYGADALAGLISVRTREPTRDWQLSGEATGGDYGTYGAGAVLGGPAGDDAAFRIVAQNYRSDGFTHNAYLHRDDTNGYDETTTRAKFHWDASDELKLDFTAMYVDLDNGYDAFAIDNSRTTQSDSPGKDAQISRAGAVRASYTGFEGLELQSISTYGDSAIHYSYDGDWGNDAFWGIYAPYDFTSDLRRDRSTWSEDLRLRSRDAGAGARLTWVLGVYTLHTRELDDELDLSNGAVYDTSIDSRYTSQNSAVYGEADVAITSATRILFGARLEHRHANYDDSNGASFDPGETLYGGHLSLEHQLDDRDRWYATVSRGYKAGGFNIGVDVPVGQRTFGAEYLWNIESGFKSAPSDSRLSYTVDVFYMRRTDEQVSSSFQLNPNDPLSFIFITGNAAAGENYGLEGDLAWQATDRLLLSGNLGLLRTRYIDYQYDDRDLSGRDQAYAPRYQAAIAAEYHLQHGLFTRLDVQHVASFYFDTSNDQRSTPYTLVNLKAGIQETRWSAFVWARNLLNQDYAMRGFYFGDEPPDFPNKRYVQPGDPRQIGATVTYTFL